MTDTHSEISVSDADIEEIRSLFLRQAAVETAHDIGIVETVLAKAQPGQPDPVNFVARAYRFWGREAVIDHFRTVFQGIWRFVPVEEEIRISPLGPDTAHIFAPTHITVGATDQEGTTYTFLVNEIAIRTPAGWRISTIVPVPAE